jgi:hypothetical protein
MADVKIFTLRLDADGMTPSESKAAVPLHGRATDAVVSKAAAETRASIVSSQAPAGTAGHQSSSRGSE